MRSGELKLQLRLSGRHVGEHGNCDDCGGILSSGPRRQPRWLSCLRGEYLLQLRLGDCDCGRHSDCDGRRNREFQSRGDCDNPGRVSCLRDECWVQFCVGDRHDHQRSRCNSRRRSECPRNSHHLPDGTKAYVANTSRAPSRSLIQQPTQRLRRSKCSNPWWSLLLPTELARM